MVLPASLETTLDNLPEQPGVYRLKDLQGEVIYIGKSKNLRERVRTYFQASPRDRKVAHLRAKTKSIDFVVLDTDWQAQEVEWDLIRSHGPEYNTLFLDYWNRPYIKLTVDDPYPRIELTQEKDDTEAEYFGPYKNTRRLRDCLIALRETFPVRDCDLDIPNGGNREKFESCIESDLGRCTAPCIGNEDSEQYRDRLGPIRAFLEGDYNRVIETLRSQMNTAAESLNFEAASIHRDRLEAVRNMVNYEPFLRETLRCDVWGQYKNCYVKLIVREHRVVDFQVIHGDSSDAGNTKIGMYDDRDFAENIICGGPIPNFFSPEQEVCSPANEEEKRLLATADRTAEKHYEIERKRTKGSVITDQITVDKNKAVIERCTTERNKGNENRNDLSINDPDFVFQRKIIPKYKRDMESGRVLPSRIKLRTQKGITFSGKSIFEGCDFWFPILVE